MASVNTRTLRALCDTLAGDLLQHGQTAESIDAHRPGGADNPKRDAMAWVRFYGQLQLQRGRAQGTQRSAYAGGPDDSRTLAALAGTPATIRIGGADRAVYPKSMSALLHCHARDALLAKLFALVAALKDHDANDEHAELVHEALGEVDYHLQVLCWIALTEGPGLPFPKHDRRPAIPEDVAALDPFTVAEINRTFAQVNWVNLRAMESLITPDPESGASSSQRPSWSVFFGSLAMELHEDPMTLIEHRPLIAVMASTSLAASARRAAMADAERAAESRRERAR